jgi:hypothetical protein
MFNSRALNLSAFFLLGVLAAEAQVAGRLSGRVVDPSGAAIPAATVKVFVPGGKEPVLTGKTNEAGLFVFVSVEPVAYDVAIEAQGFAREVLRDVKVDTLQETGLGSIKMQVQSAAQTVEVTSDVQSVQLSNVEVSSTVATSQVENLPMLERQVVNLFPTQAGVNASNAGTTINGQHASATNIMLDGINVQDNYVRTNDVSFIPIRTTIDQIAEFTVITSNANASLGGGASQVVLSTKSGSNTYHGSLYWYNRNAALSANDWFNNQAGVARPKLDVNQPGIALGGRIIRDKLFFYSNYEGYRALKQETKLDTTLTATARAGIFQYKNSGGALQSANLLTTQGFQISPVMQTLLNQLPQPNTTATGDGLNTSGYRFNVRDDESHKQFVQKIDYYITPKQSLTGTYNYVKIAEDYPSSGSYFSEAPPVLDTNGMEFLSLAWRFTATPTMTNEVRFGFLLASPYFTDSSKYPAYELSGLLFTNPVNTFVNQGRNTNTYMAQDNANWVHGKHQIQFGYQQETVHVTPFNDSGILPTYTLGLGSRNGLTSTQLPGISTSNLSTANSLYADLAGLISSAAQTFNVTSQTSGYVPGATNRRHLSWNQFAGYVHDNWKVLPRMTVSVGLRYEIWTPVVEANSLEVTPELENNNIVQTMSDPNALLNFSGGPNNPLYKTDKNNFAPNVGVAWDPFGHGKTSVRAGYMISFINDGPVAAMQHVSADNNGLSTSASLTNLAASLAAPPSVPTPAFQIPRTLLSNYLVSTSNEAGDVNPALVTPYVQEWTIGIQHEFKDTIFEARYVGNHSTKLIREINMNQVLYNQAGFLADFKRAQSNLALSGNKSAAYNSSITGSQQLTVFPQLPSAGNLTSTTIINYLNEGEVGQLASYYQTTYGLGSSGGFTFFNNPAVPSGAMVDGNGGSATYNALQLEIRRRTRAGLLYQFNYTFSKAMSNMFGDTGDADEPQLDNNNPGLEKSREPFDITQSFKANFYYELPYGPGKRWHGGKAMNLALGNWAVSGIWSYNSGMPYSILSGIGTLNTNSRSEYENTGVINGTTMSQLQAVTNGVYMTGNGPYFVSPSIINPADGRAAEFGSTFTNEMFFNPGAGNLGNTQMRMFTGPWQMSWDMSMKKGFRIFERQTLDLHFDFFNFLNHPTFYMSPSDPGGSITNFTINNATFGKITSMNYNPRIIQIGAYYRF